jgi:hypothetical protein
VRVDGGEVELAGNEKEHGAHGGKAGIAAGFAFGRLEEAIEGLDEAIGLTSWVQATMPSKCLRIMRATSFIGATLERKTFVHHCLSIAATTLICLRSRMARKPSR